MNTLAEPVVTSAPAQAVAALKRAPSARVLGYDIARAVAIASMLVDHCAQVLGPSPAAGWNARLQEWLDGRASAVFVVLAGVGVSLLNRRHDAAHLRSVLLRRGGLLLLIGFVNQAIWQGDILRVFGVALMLAGFLVPLGKRGLLAVAAGLFLAFPVMYGCFDFDARWDWTTMRYRGLWTPAGVVRNLFFDGFRPVIPWAGLLVFGMWLGRLDASRRSVRRAMLLWGVGLTIAAEATAPALLRVWLAHRCGASEETIRTWADTCSLPPLPLFVMSVTGTALAVMALGLMAGFGWPAARATGALVATGQMALTWYVAHIAAGAVVVGCVGWHRLGSLGAAVGVGVVAFAAMVLVSALSKRRFRNGPMEWLLRVVG
jgi:uncharacterized membrane protein YeiB